MGAAYRINGDPKEILAYLDHREKGGYDRMSLQVLTDLGPLQVLVYVGTPACREYVGPEDESITASIIRSAIGPSGRNIDYLTSLKSALDELGERDPHVDALLGHCPQSLN